MKSKNSKGQYCEGYSRWQCPYCDAGGGDKSAWVVRCRLAEHLIEKHLDAAFAAIVAEIARENKIAAIRQEIDLFGNYIETV